MLANQALETTKNSVLDAVRGPEPAKPAEAAKPAAAPAAGPDVGAIIVSQVQAMQRPLKEDQELHVSVRAGHEMLRIREIFVPHSQVLVLSGIDSQGNLTRFIAAAETVQLVCKIVKVAQDAAPLRVNVMTPKPRPDAPAA